MNTAFIALRAYSRDHNEKLSHVAQALVRRAMPATDVLPRPHPGNEQT
jgi:hypothetical protein